MKINEIQRFKLIPILFFTSLIITNINGTEHFIHDDFKQTPLGFYENNPACGGRYNEELSDSDIKSQYLEMSPVKNQGPLGTCVSFAVGACYEYYEKGYKVSDAEFTVLAQTYLSTVEGANCTSGLFLGKAAEVANRMGFIRESRLTYEEYLKYVARYNEIDINSETWKEELEDKIKLSEKEKTDFFICKKRGANIRDYNQTIKDYNETMRGMEKNISLQGNTSDITIRRLGCIYQIHHISSHDLEGYLIDNSCANLHEGTVGSPGFASINAVRHALLNGLPVPAALALTQEYQYIYDFSDEHNIPYFNKDIKSPWDDGKSVINIPNVCYRDSSEDKTVVSLRQACVEGIIFNLAMFI